MTDALAHLLTRIAEDAGPGPVEPDLWARARRARRRERTLLASAAAVLAVATVVAGIILVNGSGPTNVSEPAAPQHTGLGSRAADRPLTYAAGTTLHFGDQTIDHATAVVEVDLTDDGVAFRDAADRVFFLWGDGHSEQLGSVRPASEGTTDHVASAWTGSLLAWPAPDRTVVLYDTATRQVRARVPLTEPASVSVRSPVIAPDAVSWEEITDIGDSVGFVEYDRDTGTHRRLSEAQWHAVQSYARVCCRPEPVWLFAVQGGLLRSAPDGGMGWDDTSRTFRLEAHDGQWVVTGDWLDAGRVVGVAKPRLDGPATGDLLVCDVRARQCHVVADGPQHWVLPHFEDVR